MGQGRVRGLHEHRLYFHATPVFAMFDRPLEIICRATVNPEAEHACDVSVLCGCRKIKRLRVGEIEKISSLISTLLGTGAGGRGVANVA